MLLIDGVKYEEWTPKNEEELERIVNEHASEIFGEASIYIDRKLKLQSLSGVGSIPDGYVITLEGTPQWRIIEVELSSHQLYNHIVPQVSRFTSGINNPSTQKTIVEAIYHAIIADKSFYTRMDEWVQTGEIYKFLSDLISKTPAITVIIEKDVPELTDALRALAHPLKNVLELRTFTREDVGLAVHAHQFNPLHQAPPKKITITEIAKKEPTTTRKVELIAWPGTRGRLNISKDDRDFFPDYGQAFTIVTDIGEFTNGLYQQKDGKDHFHLKKWIEAHPEVKGRDKVTLEAIEPKKIYRLEIAK